MRFLFAAAGLAAGLAVGLTAGAASAQQTLKLAHNAAPGNPKAEASIRFAELVAEKTEGRINVDVGGSAQYGDDVEALTQMRLGTLAFAANSQGSSSGVVPEFGVLGLPFLFADLPTAWKVLDGPAGDYLKQKAAEKGLIVLAFWDNGIRQVSNNVRAVNSPADLAGLKLRTPPDPMTIDIFTALGANPTPMNFSELYVALQQGVVDGQENPLMNIYSSKLYEVQKYISLTGHKYETTPVMASAIVWSALSDEDKAAIQEAAVEAGEFNRQASLEADERLRGELEAAGVAFNSVERQPFVDATKSVYDKWRDQFPEFVDLVVKSAEEAAAQ